MKHLKTLGIAITITTLISASCKDDDEYIIKGESGNKKALAESIYASNTDNSLHFTYTPDADRAKEIYNYFRLDTLINDNMSTWDKALKITKFTVAQIPHLNQKGIIEHRNAIDIWEFAKNTEPGVNCRMHSIFLSELFFAAGITNRFITCRPLSSTDDDCHVVNVAWIPEMEKWVMLDSDMCAYITDDNGIPLSLQEMRINMANGGAFNINFLKSVVFSADYYRAYWAKNLYWFCSHEKNGFNVEPASVNSGDRYILLIPTNFDCYDIGEHDVVTHDDQAFWAKPE